jgi:type IV fimbrial biogenesis protein FimT
MVTIGVAAIITVIALPNLQAFIENSRRDSTVNDIVGAMNYARGEALSLNQNTYVCPGTAVPTSTTCPGGSWSNGWEVITVTSGATVANQLSAHTLSTATTTPAVVALYSSTSVEFKSSGTVAFTGNTGTGSNEILVVCDARSSSYARAVEVNSAGYIQSSSQTGQTPDGVAIVCTAT